MNRLTRKLEQHTLLGSEDRIALDDLAQRSPRMTVARQDIISKGDAPRGVNIVLSGWACRYEQLGDGRRQIVAFLVPGDMCDPNTLLLQRMDHCMGTLTPVLLAELSREVLNTLRLRSPRIYEAMLRDALVASAVQRQWIVNIGQRPATERLGHILLELFTRMQAVGLVEDNSCELPLVQTDLASATGLSAVHVNRALQELRSSGLVVLEKRRLYLPDRATLSAAVRFDPSYLHLRREDASSG